MNFHGARSVSSVNVRKSLEISEQTRKVAQIPTFMKTSILALVSALAAISLSSCGAPAGPNTQRGAATGALGGALLGGIVGNQSGRALEGAAIGALGGAAVGGTYGNARDQEVYGRY
jgi:uncharacterized protein YcfJ